MSVGEFSEYIKFINEEIEAQNAAMSSSNSPGNNSGDVQMAGNSLPFGIF